MLVASISFFVSPRSRKLLAFLDCLAVTAHLTGSSALLWLPCCCIHRSMCLASCSRYSIPVFMRRATHFYLPEDVSRPVIMVRHSLLCCDIAVIEVCSGGPGHWRCSLPWIPPTPPQPAGGSGKRWNMLGLVARPGGIHVLSAPLF
jgi:hypothetical protein